MSKRSATFALLVFFPLAVSGCATSRHEVHAPMLTADLRGVVFAVDGAGGFEATSAALRHVVQAEGMALEVETFDWSHGYGRFLADQVDWSHAREEGLVLAGQIIAVRRVRPEGEIYLVGHSAGSAVVLAAAEALPSGTVDRIVFLAPSVSADYDIRPALRCSRQGVDVFYSSRDVGYLGLGIALVGTADRQWWTAAAGRVGFRPVVETLEDPPLYARLRQHPWNPCVEWTGNHGGHYGGYQRDFLRAYVMPLLVSPKGGLLAEAHG